MLGAYKSNIYNGTTTASYVNAQTVDTRGCGAQGKLIVQITNKDLSSTMYYKIDGYLADPAAGSTSVPIHITSQTSIAANTTVVDTNVSQVYAAVVISVVDNSGHCAHQIQYCTY
jgi:hypothetical protein